MPFWTTGRIVPALHQLLTFASGAETLPVATTVEPLASALALTGTLYLKVVDLALAASATAGTAAAQAVRSPIRRASARRHDGRKRRSPEAGLRIGGWFIGGPF